MNEEKLKEFMEKMKKEMEKEGVLGIIIVSTKPNYWQSTWANIDTGQAIDVVTTMAEALGVRK